MREDDEDSDDEGSDEEIDESLVRSHSHCSLTRCLVFHNFS